MNLDELEKAIYETPGKTPARSLEDLARTNPADVAAWIYLESTETPGALHRLQVLADGAVNDITANGSEHTSQLRRIVQDVLRKLTQSQVV